MTSGVRTAESSFWEVGGYKANIRRIREGAEHLDEYAKMVKERMDIEHKYGKSLQSWHAKWLGYTSESLPDSVVKQCWTGLIEEAHELARVHLAARERCTDELQKTVMLFRKENYHQSAIRGFKEAKEMEDEFEKVGFCLVFTFLGSTSVEEALREGGGVEESVPLGMPHRKVHFHPAYEHAGRLLHGQREHGKDQGAVAALQR